MLRRLGAFAALLSLLAAPPALAAAGTGRLIEVEQMAALGLPVQRLTIWLPPGYDASKRRYGVVYMHDGHNLFDPKKSNFNKVWAADKAMLAAMRHGAEPHIIVGIWAPGNDRYRQYLPQPAYDLAGPALRATMDKVAGGPIVSNAYLAWLTGPLKAYVDSHYRTKRGPGDTTVAGSSMGGLISCWAFVMRPDIYGRAACVSTHWPLAIPEEGLKPGVDALEIDQAWFTAHLGRAKGRRLWMDHGTATLDAFYAPYQEPIDVAVAKAGWKRGRDFQSKVYPGAEHEENAWAARLPEIFEFLLR